MKVYSSSVDPGRITKRVGLGEILVDSSVAAQELSFPRATEIADVALERTPTFRFAVDVVRARRSRILRLQLASERLARSIPEVAKRFGAAVRRDDVVAP